MGRLFGRPKHPPTLLHECWPRPAGFVYPDPSREPRCVGDDRRADGPGGRAVLPDFADGDGWPHGAAEGGLSRDRAGCSNDVPGHSSGRSRTVRRSLARGKSVDEKGVASCLPSFLRGGDWTTAQKHGRLPVLRWWVLHRAATTGPRGLVQSGSSLRLGHREYTIFLFCILPRACGADDVEDN